MVGDVHKGPGSICPNLSVVLDNHTIILMFGNLPCRRVPTESLTKAAKLFCVFFQDALFVISTMLRAFLENFHPFFS